tara:strand:- start:713 stop:982 length:270 start_codon:yes stop_codon:yes gene_type:complete
MKKKRIKIGYFQNTSLIFLGFLLGVGFIWPGIVKDSGRKCFLKIIKDGSDGNISIGTMFSITPNFLLKIKNAQNKYFKVLLVGDFCFRR